MRSRVLALAGLLALPTLAAAQGGSLPTLPNPYQLAPARFTITPFVGVRVPYTTGDEYLSTQSQGTYLVQEERAGGVMIGAELQGQVRGPLGVAGSLAYGGGGTTSITLTSQDGEQTPLTTSGPDMWMGKVGITYRLPEPRSDTRRFHPAGFLVAGPARVRTNFDNDDDSGADWAKGTTNWGFNLGVHTATLIGSSQRFALHLGLEDFVTFWNTDRIAGRDAAVYGGFFDEDTAVRVDYSTSNVVLVRAGVSFRF